MNKVLVRFTVTKYFHNNKEATLEVQVDNGQPLVYYTHVISFLPDGKVVTGDRAYTSAPLVFESSVHTGEIRVYQNLDKRVP